MAKHFLKENYENSGGALSNKQTMEIFLRYIGDTGFQLGFGKDIGIHQCTVSRAFSSVVEQIVKKASFPQNLTIVKGQRILGRKNLSFYVQLVL